MQNVLWLASWYPNKYDPYNGDFIQRHAIAASPFCNLTVITLQFVPSDWQKALVVIERLTHNSFPETIIYLKKSNLPSPFNKVIDQYRFIRAYKNEVNRLLLIRLPERVHVHVPIKAGIIGLWLKNKLCIPLVVTEHWGIYNDFAPDKFSEHNIWFKTLTKRIIAAADSFLPVSKNLGDSINKLVLSKPFMVVNNVVDTNLFFYIAKEHNSLFWITHVSMMNHPKNPKGLLRVFSEALKKNNQLRLRVIGHSTKEIIEYCNELQISESVVFTGMLPHNEVAGWLQKSDCFLLFSLYENMPCVIAEALCCGLPVISSDVGGISEIITYENGILVSPSDESACAKAILEISANKHHFNQIQISEKATAQFSYDTIGRKIASVYHN